MQFTACPKNPSHCPQSPKPEAEEDEDVDPSRVGQPGLHPDGQPLHADPKELGEEYGLEEGKRDMDSETDLPIGPPGPPSTSPSLPIPIPGEQRYKQSHGEIPHEELPDHAVFWSGHVIKTPLWAPPGTSVAVLQRPRDKASHGFGKLKPEFEPKFLLTNEMDKELEDLLEDSAAQQITVKRSVDRKQFSAQISVSRLLTAKRDIMQSLLAQNALDLPQVDLFRTVRPADTPVLQGYLDSVHGNIQHVRLKTSLRALPGRVVALQGPAGTGKTASMLALIVVPLCYLGRDSTTPSLPLSDNPKVTGHTRHQTMIVVPQNCTVDTLAVKTLKAVNHHLDAQISRRPNQIPPLVIRLHSFETEKAWVRKDLTRKPARPPAHDEKGMEFVGIPYESLSYHELLYFERMTQDVKGASGMHDPRFQLETMSLGFFVMSFAGYIPGSPWSDPDRWDNFRARYEGMKGEKGEEENEKNRALFTSLLKSLVQYILSQADVILCTVHAASQGWVYNSTHPDVVMIDEATMLSEASLWPILAYYEPTAFILSGDEAQLRPHSTSPLESHLRLRGESRPKSNWFKAQFLTSLFCRMMYSGSVAGYLNVQYRMTGDIAIIANSVFYFGNVWTAPSTLPTARQTSKDLRKFNLKQFGIKSNLIFCDVKGEEEQRTGAVSFINPSFREKTISLVISILSSTKFTCKDIVILTPYADQQAQYLDVLYSEERVWEAQSRRRKDQTLKISFSGIRVETIDSFQGQEAEIIVFDLVRTSSWGFLCDKHRLCTALTRALSGLYVIFNWEETVLGKMRNGNPAMKRILEIVHSDGMISSERSGKLYWL